MRPCKNLVASVFTGATSKQKQIKKLAAESSSGLVATQIHSVCLTHFPNESNFYVKLSLQHIYSKFVNFKQQRATASYIFNSASCHSHDVKTLAFFIAYGHVQT